MPTENRSSNTEMVSVPEGFMLVERSIWTEQQVEAATACITRLKGVPGMRDCDLAMAAIDAAQCKAPDIALSDLLPAPQPHPDPIAWMVGTAIWWTKEEAERDAASTGLPVVAIGPMPTRQDEPAWFMTEGGVSAMHAKAKAMSAQQGLDTSSYCVPLYTHADPGEVERLRLERRRMDQALSACANERDTLRTLLVEALAFLDEAYKHDIGTQLKREIKAFYLSASAEPSAPVAQA
ncbi:hypothetical protein LU646_11850 [Pseudomonas alloputida]|uniref:hypothetical protein n=1 Tax=Pseudomonas alloputida TaxID=1940621 RepID=UPI001E30333F|nr:hypothetical protein [Pseudomonas alloputida]MCE1058568.1 hypothetical protein [Pseudomonas alloputida]